MKRFSLVALLSTAATYVHAGSISPVIIQEPEVISDAAPMGSSGAWIIPLIAIIAIVVVVATSDPEDEPEDNPTGTPTNDL